MILAPLLLSSALAAPPLEAVPHNYDEMPWLDPALASPAERAEARALKDLPTFGPRNWMRAYLRLTMASPMAAWLVSLERPGPGHEALGAPARAWHELVAALPGEERARLLRREGSIEIPWSGIDPALQARLFGGTRLGDIPGAVLQLEPGSTLLPVPMRFVEGRLVSRGEVVRSDRFGFSPALYSILFNRRLRRWQEAGERYARWRTLDLGPVIVHHDPAVEAAAEKAQQMAEQARFIIRWAGGDPELHAPVHAYVYPDTDTMWAYGQPPWDFALIRQRQVHQHQRATRGHELAHVLLHDLWGPAGNEAMSEGAAVFLNGDNDLFVQVELAGLGALPLDPWVIGDAFAYTEEDYLKSALLFAWAVEEGGPALGRRVYEAKQPSEVLGQALGMRDEVLQMGFQVWFEAMQAPSTAGL